MITYCQHYTVGHSLSRCIIEDDTSQLLYPYVCYSGEQTMKYSWSSNLLILETPIKNIPRPTTNEGYVSNPDAFNSQYTRTLSAGYNMLLNGSGLTHSQVR